MSKARDKLAKLQAMGVYRVASKQGAINKGETEYSGGDFRPVEASKACYGKAASWRDDSALVAAYLREGGKVETCPAFTDSRGTVKRGGDLNRKRARCLPQARYELLPGMAACGGAKVTMGMGKPGKIVKTGKRG